MYWDGYYDGCGAVLDYLIEKGLVADDILDTDNELNEIVNGTE